MIWSTCLPMKTYWFVMLAVYGRGALVPGGFRCRLLEWTGVTHRASYGAMLDRLAGGRPVEPLRILADAARPAVWAPDATPGTPRRRSSGWWTRHVRRADRFVIWSN